MLASTILLIDDDSDLRFSLRRLFERRGFQVKEADSVAAACGIFRAASPDLAILDHHLPDGDGIELLERLRAIDPGVPMVILTGFGSIELAVSAIKLGAEQFLTKPVESEALLVVAERLLRARQAVRSREARLAIDERGVEDPFVGTSPAILALREEAFRIAATSMPVLIEGETGSGKGVLARWLHARGTRREEAFVDLNCAGLSKDLLENELFGHEKGAFTGALSAKPGLLEVAHRGTLFLDEIGEMSMEIQPRLLKVLEEQRFRRVGEVKQRQVDLRLIAATHHDLAARAAAGTFREDLLWRINTARLELPPLRARGTDVVALARRLLDRFAIELGRPGLRLDGQAEDVLMRHRWPGNVRELRNVIERSLLLVSGNTLSGDDLAAVLGARSGAAGRPAPRTLKDVEREHIDATLRALGGDVSAAARQLGLSRSALYKKMQRHAIPPPLLPR